MPDLLGQGGRSVKDLLAWDGFERAATYMERLGSMDAKTVFCSFVGEHAESVSDEAVLMALAVLINSVGEDAP